MRIGLISDTHIPAVGKELPEQVRKAFYGVDLILHAGDIVIPRVLDFLATIAPTLAARGNEDHILFDDPRIQLTHVLTVEGIRIGLTHYPVFEYDAEMVFKEAVDIVVFGHTHEVEAAAINGILYCNPGSATNPGNFIKPGTVGILEIENGRAHFKAVQL